MSDRREALKIIGAIGVTCAFPFAANDLYGQHVHAPGSAVQLIPKPSYFTPAELATVSRLSDLIIPASDTPGAIGAGVPAYIDYVVKQNKPLQDIFKKGIEWLDAKAKSEQGSPFIELKAERQIAMLEPLCEAADLLKLDDPGTRFFASVKNLTADGYYTSQVGLIQELDYNGNTVLAEFPVAEVPEH